MSIYTKFSGVFIFANFVNFEPYAKLFQEGLGLAHSDCKITGVGAGPDGPVLARPLFRRFIIKIAYSLRTCLLQSDHFKSVSYAPEDGASLTH